MMNCGKRIFKAITFLEVTFRAILRIHLLIFFTDRGGNYYLSTKTG